MTKILVTGGAGYVGSVLCGELLNRGYEVKCMDNGNKGSLDSIIPYVAHSCFEFIDGDVTNKEDCNNAVKGVDGIIHLAGIVGFPACKKNPALAEAVNVLGTKNILTARARENYNIPFVNASTGSVYGAVEGICTEDSPLNGNTLYATTKREAEKMSQDAGNSVSFRFATGFGVSPNMRVNLLVNDFVYKAIYDRCIVVFQADFRRTFIHVRDMSEAFIQGFEKLRSGDLRYSVYNAGANSLNWTKRELANYVSEKTGCYIHFGEIGEDLDKRDYEVDYSKFESDVCRCQVSMEQGIDELIKVVKVLRTQNKYE